VSRLVPDNPAPHGSISMDPVSSRVLEAAIAWQLLLDDEDTSPTQRAQFERWHAADAEHARAWAQLCLLDQRFTGTSRPARQALLQSREGLRGHVRKLGGLTGLLLVGALSLMFGQRLLPLDYWLAEQRTGTGEQRMLQLSDGTRVNLNTHSAIDVRYDADQRVIILREGEILVETGHRDNDPRPLLVKTRDGQLRAIGTRFLVRRKANGTLVSVLASAVAIRSRDEAEEHVLHEGQQALFHADRFGTITALPSNADTWARGMLVVDNARLADLLGELGRYRKGYLAASPEVADLRITGSFPLDNTDLALQALLPTLPVQINQHRGWWTTIEAR
jgi:transmembrane sensor